MQKISLNEGDYLNFQLHAATRSKFIKRRKYVSWIITVIIFLTGSSIFYSNGNNTFGLYCLVLSVIAGVGHPIYSKWRYIQYYRKYIRQNYKNSIGLPFHIEFQDDYLFICDTTGESRTKITEIEQIDETKMYFFIKIKNSQTVIIPKAQLDSWTFGKELENIANRIDIIINKDSE